MSVLVKKKKIFKKKIAMEEVRKKIFLLYLRPEVV